MTPPDPAAAMPRLADAIAAYITGRGDGRAREVLDDAQADTCIEVWLADVANVHPAAITLLRTVPQTGGDDEHLIDDLDRTIRDFLDGNPPAPDEISAADVLVTARMIYGGPEGPVMEIYAVDGDGQILRAAWNCVPGRPHLIAHRHGPIEARLITLRQLLVLPASTPVAAGCNRPAAPTEAEPDRGDNGGNGLDTLIRAALGAAPDWAEASVASVYNTDTMSKWLAGVGELVAADQMRGLVHAAYETLANPDDPGNLDVHGVEIETAVRQYNTLTERRDQLIAELQTTGRQHRFLEPDEPADQPD